MVMSVYHELTFLSELRRLRFKEEGKDIIDDPHLGFPGTMKSIKNLKKIGKIILENGCLSIRKLTS